MKILALMKRAVFKFLPGEYRTRVYNHAYTLLTFFTCRRLYGGRDLPVAIEIETDWRCTRACWYCSRQNQGEAMAEELFRSIIAGLKTWGFKGRVSLHGYNEPLLDKRLCEFIKYIKINLPGCPIVIYSNGDLLTKKTVLQLIAAGMDRMMVSIHEPSSEIKILELAEIASEYPVVQLMDFRDGYRNFALWNRGNEELAIKLGAINKHSRCYFIFTCVVKSNGNVLLCCHDGRGEYVMGSLTANSLQEIWESSKFKKIRGQVCHGTFTLPICKRCGYQAFF
ncbi:MAG TPA: SPASM domain-containing protein [Smithella sp.]|nr:SPASM domain-containing protein [Smithella sp.]